MVRDILEPREFPSLDSCQKRFLWAHKEVDLAPHQVVGHAFLEGDAEKFPHGLFGEREPVQRKQMILNCR